jgi:hypothetical protein
VARSEARASGDGGGGVAADGRVSVSVRLRPLFPKERAGGASEVFLKDTDTSLVEQKADGSIQAWRFMEHVFGPLDSTASVFDAVCTDLLNQVLEGYNASIFAYGQTASGKTYTIFGDEGAQGLIAFAVNHLFSTRVRNATHTGKKDGSANNASIVIRVSIIEIYNEQVRRDPSRVAAAGACSSTPRLYIAVALLCLVAWLCRTLALVALDLGPALRALGGPAAAAALGAGRGPQG